MEIPARTVRFVLLGLGAAALARGAWLLVIYVDPAAWIDVGLWLALVVAVHDGLIAPGSALVGRATLPRLPRAWRIAVRGAWLATGGVLVVGVPLIVGATQRQNPSVIPGNPVAGTVAAVAAVVLAAAVAGLVLRLVPVRRPGPGVTPPDGAAPGTPAPPSATPR